MAEQRRRSKEFRDRPEVRGEQRDMEGLRAYQLAREAGRETPGRVGRAARGVLVEVCLECGKEYTFDERAPDELVCEKCGNTVFRSFFDVSQYDEVDADFRAATERDLAPNDTESDVTRGDIEDLNNL